MRSGDSSEIGLFLGFSSPMPFPTIGFTIDMNLKLEDVRDWLLGKVDDSKRDALCEELSHPNSDASQLLIRLVDPSKWRSESEAAEQESQISASPCVAPSSLTLDGWVRDLIARDQKAADSLFEYAFPILTRELRGMAETSSLGAADIARVAVDAFSEAVEHVRRDNQFQNNHFEVFFMQLIAAARRMLAVSVREVQAKNTRRFIPTLLDREDAHGSVRELPFEDRFAMPRGGSPSSMDHELESSRSSLSAIALQRMTAELGSDRSLSDPLQVTSTNALDDMRKIQPGWWSWLRSVLITIPLGLVWRQTVTNPLSPDSRAPKKELGESVQLAMNRLSDRDRQILILRFHEQCTFEEMGRELGCSPVAARRACREAVGRLRNELDSP